MLFYLNHQKNLKNLLISKKMVKDNEAYKTIGEVVKILDLNSKNKNQTTHTIRFWEKEFKQIKPKILNGNRRYYDIKNIEIIKKSPFFIKRSRYDN